MKKILLSASVAAVALAALAAAKNDDPVLMTVNKRPVHLSEFEYLYNKNNSQQIQPQSLDEYVTNFVDFKLKVADALANGLDTTKSFRDEFDHFRSELASPYMYDSVVLNKYIEEALSHYGTEVSVGHIMLSVGDNEEMMKQNTAILDSIRQAIIDGKTTFEDAARANSLDQGSAANGGHMGWVLPGRFPWPFEKAAYDTADGQLSPVVNSGYFLHIVRPEERRKSRGEVTVRHILKLTARKSPEEAERAKQQIDSLYKVVTTDGVDFAEVASKESDDPGSAANGGLIDWFGSGVMVAEFDSVSFALNDGEISKPVKTAYGYHIVKKEGHRDTEINADKLRPVIEDQVLNDERGADAARSRMNQLLAAHNASVLPEGKKYIEDVVKKSGELDSVTRATLEAADVPLLIVDGKTYPVSFVMKDGVGVNNAKDATAIIRMIDTTVDRTLRDLTLEAEREAMISSNPEYRNLVNEYRDGILLFDISNRNVWEKASADKAGLEKFFEANKAKYTNWEKPKFKGYIVFASNDSIESLAKAFCDSIAPTFDANTFVEQVRGRFGRLVKVERVLAAQGDNAISDYLAFNGPRPDDSKLTWKYFFTFNGKIIDQPEEAIDVRAAVITDYQNSLEKAWLHTLRQKYPVKINKKVLKKVKGTEQK